MPHKKNSQPQRPTMKMIADELGISRQLVSIVMREQPGASEETRQRVKEKARQMGYYPDASAQALRGKRTHRLGAIFSMREQFEVDMVERLFESARERGFSLVLAPLTEERTEEQAITYLLSQRVEGVFLLSADRGRERFGALPEGLPAVTLMGPLAGVTDFRADDVTGISLLVDHLVELGHCRIAYVSAGQSPNGLTRENAFRAAAERHGIADEVTVVSGAMTEIGGASATQQLLEADEKPTAILGANDRCASGIIGTLSRAGYRVPEDISVAGYDNSSIAGLPYLDMTSVDYNIKTLTVEALKALVDMVNAVSRGDQLTAEATAHVQAPSLVVRGTTAPPSLEVLG